jgi:hypothetical protein
MGADQNFSTGDALPAGTVEWTEYRFSEIDENDLFWIEKVDDNRSYRKLEEASGKALNNITQRLHEFPPDLVVYQKDW